MKQIIHGSVHEELVTLSAQENLAGVASLSAGGSASLDEDGNGVFLPFPRPQVDDVWFLGAMLIA